MKKWYFIRHIRYAWYSFEFWRWWDSYGHALGAVPNPRDLEFLEGVRLGKW